MWDFLANTLVTINYKYKMSLTSILSVPKVGISEMYSYNGLKDDKIEALQSLADNTSDI